jgi:heme-degrading monooxygenase HmoA
MHARVVLGKVKHDKQDEANKIYREILEPAAKEQKGFVRMHLLTDPDTGKFISISIWETEQDMITGESSGYLQEQMNKIATLFVGPPSVQHYVVSN